MPDATSGVFICYRRNPDTHFAGRLRDRLAGRLGDGRVFMDIENVEPGEVFTEVLAKTLDKAQVVIVVIGHDWLTCKDTRGRTKLSNPNDYVRLEIATALKRNVRVIPVLIDDARMPEAEDLPGDLAPLSVRQAITIHHDRFHQGAAKTIEVCEKVLTAAAAAPIVPDRTDSEQRHEAPAIVAHASRRAGETEVNAKDGLTYVWIPPGSFIMGSSPGDAECRVDEKPAHKVTITKGFWLGQTPVTQAAYRRVMGESPSHFKGENRPVERVTWNQAVEYCRAIGGRLPTEAEWEYAARAGTKGSGYGNLDEIAWHRGNSAGETHDVARKKPNAWGVYDMLGNVWEWTADWYGGYSEEEQNDPRGASNDKYRVVRGASFYVSARYLRAAFRFRFVPDGRDGYIGFRCVRE